ncbi:MAG: Unknown protein [uncultured Campylobacterales bacterium]|uniref:Uncharacterized protein n=1 Tax=uncultured Campylobacterales bacterium TaxID=352960 RepID=A0A6S6T8V2_9BACT|nr:MAG: Unknown protein [uncultured Campylobacterales bacterium]
MQRRNFIKSSAILALTITSCAKTNNYFWTTIENAQNILMPKSKFGPSAKELQSTKYLKNVSIHSSFDSRDIRVLKQGVKYLYEKNFNVLPKSKKEKLLNNFSQSGLGSQWVSLMLYYTIESTFCDPIYGGNTNQIGWNWVNHPVGYPRPKKTFGNVA